jgi:hypothetical protein
MVAPSVLTEAEYATEISLDDRQMLLPFEFPPAIPQETTEDERELCRWENDGGALRKEDGYGD